MSREDTSGYCIEDGVYKMIVYCKKSDSLLNEASWAFRILRFLGAPTGFTVNWWCIDKPRLVEPNMFPTRAEVNGGWAYRGRPAVWVFRLEEWDRVLIHECVHALNWDIYPSATVKACLEESINGTLVDALGEAATEIIAEWFWSIIHSPVKDITGVTWEKQKAWQLKQAGQILARCPEQWSEDTSVFAYYLLKAALAKEDTVFFLGWYSGDTSAEYWCDCWKRHVSGFFPDKSSVKDRIILRMTDPNLE